MIPPKPSALKGRLEDFGRRHPTALVTLVFTDLVDSVALRRDLGDQAAATLLQTHRGRVRDLLHAFVEAEEIETAGDSFLLLFAKPSDAVKFALLMQHQTRALAGEHNVALADRIGIHIGEVVIEEHRQGLKPKDLYGSQIDLCARVMSLAAGDQVLLTSAVFDTARQAIKGEELPGLHELQWLNHGSYVLKGIDEEITICEVGEVGIGVLKAPVGSEKARRKVTAEEEPVLGWRPALGQEVPNTQWILERKLGEGGFGEAWLGRHQKLKERRVFKFCFRADRVRSLKREMTLFRVLKERVGNHPNIVRLLEVYFEEPPFYVVMDHVDGQDLRGWCEHQGGAENVALRVRLEIVAQVADALQAAHDAGVIHRDVKPGNILVSSQSSVTGDPLSRGGDEGSAVSGQKLESELNSEASDLPVVVHQWPTMAKLTDFGIGQVVSEEVLKGVTKSGFTETLVADSSSSHTGSQMYMAPELLAGKTASIRSDIYSLGVVLYQLLAGDLTRPVTTDWANDIDDPLLCDDLQHCFAGNPNERFAGAGQLAKQLRGLQQRQVALARQQAELAAKERAAYRRGVIRATSLAAIVLAVMAGLGIFVWKEARRAVAGELAARRNLYAADMIRASQALAESNLGQAVRLLGKYDSTPEQRALRGWEWSYLWGQTRSDELFQLGRHSKTVHSMAFSPNGRFVVSGSRDHTAVVWDVEGRRKLAVLQHSNTVTALAFSPDGTLATLEDQGKLVRLWDPVTGYRSSAALVHTNELSSIAFAPDGKTLAAACLDRVALWDVATRREKSSLPISNGSRLTFSPNGQILAVAREDGSILLWNLRTESTSGTLSGYHAGNSGSLTFSPNGRQLFGASSDMQPTIWNVATLQEEVQLTNHHSWVGCGSFSRDGSRLATASADQTVKLWDTATWKEVGSLRGHLDEVWTVAFSPTSDILATGSKDGLIKLWSSEPVVQAPSEIPLGGSIQWALLSADCSTAITINPDRTVSVYGMDPLRQLNRGPLPVTNWSCACLLPNGRTIAWGSSDGKITVCDTYSMAVRKTLSVSASGISALALSRDGTTFGAAAADGTISVVELNTGIVKGSFQSSERGCDVLAFSDDGTMLVGSYPASDLVEVWNLRTEKRLALLKGHFAPVNSILVFPDQRTLATSSLDATVRLWNIADSRLIETLAGELNAFWCLALSPDGRRLAAGGSDGIIKLWDTTTKQEVATLRGNRASVWRLAFSPDGKRLGSIIGNTIHIWRAESVAQIDATE